MKFRPSLVYDRGSTCKSYIFIKKEVCKLKGDRRVDGPPSMQLPKEKQNLRERVTFSLAYMHLRWKFLDVYSGEV
jgi:hypothetical protein